MRGDTVALLVSGGIGIAQLLAVLPAIFWIDKVGRRSLLRGEYSRYRATFYSNELLGGSIAMAISHFGIAVLVIFFQSDWSAHSSAAWIAIGYVIFF